MALKYFFEYLSVDNTEYRCEIESDSYTGESTEINGRCTLEYAEVEDHFTPIRGCGMIMRLDASINLPFDDLATENERVYKTTLYRDGDIIFVGFISPEGIYEDWVDDKWAMDISVTGGLGFLENLSYVDENGLPFLEAQTPLEIITNCLKRTGLLLKINTSIDFEYEGFVSNDGFGDINILRRIKLLTDRFIRDDEDTIMDCKEVLESTLNIFNACICQMSGEWWVFKSSEVLRSNDGLTFFENSYLGVPTLRNTRAIPTLLSIGSQINGADIFHCNANQRKERRNSLAGFKLNYKYGLIGNLFVNEYMKTVGLFGYPGTLEGWSYLNSDKATFTLYNDEAYFALKSYRGQDDLYSGDTPQSVIVSDNINVTEGTFLTLEIDTIFQAQINSMLIKVYLNTGGTVYFLDVDEGWIETGDPIIYLKGVTAPFGGPKYHDNNFEINTPEIIGDGTLTITFMQPLDYWAETHLALIKRFKVYPSTDNSINGEFHTAQRTTSPSNRVPDVLEVYNGDNSENIYEGTIYKNDEETQTSLWTRNFENESKPLLQLVVEERIRTYSGVQTVFNGDIYGYIPYLSKVLIDGVDGRFMPLYYSFDTLLNITSLTNVQGYVEEIDDIVYEFEIDYGNTVKPTIKG